MLLSGADIIVKTLIEQGCDVVFGYPGGQILNVYDSLYKYSDEIPHPDIHPSSWKNPCHCSLQSDIPSCPDR